MLTKYLANYCIVSLCLFALCTADIRIRNNLFVVFFYAGHRVYIVWIWIRNMWFLSELWSFLLKLYVLWSKRRFTRRTRRTRRVIRKYVLWISIAILGFLMNVVRSLHVCLAITYIINSYQMPHLSLMSMSLRFLERTDRVRRASSSWVQLCVWMWLWWRALRPTTPGHMESVFASANSELFG